MMPCSLRLIRYSVLILLISFTQLRQGSRGCQQQPPSLCITSRADLLPSDTQSVSELWACLHLHTSASFLHLYSPPHSTPTPNRPSLNSLHNSTTHLCVCCLSVCGGCANVNSLNCCKHIKGWVWTRWSDSFSIASLVWKKKSGSQKQNFLAKDHLLKEKSLLTKFRKNLNRDFERPLKWKI